MYLIIEQDYTLSTSKVLTGHLRSRARQGEISLVNCKDMVGLNLATFPYSGGEEWSTLNTYTRAKV